MEDDFNFFENGRQRKYFVNGRRSKCLEMELDVIFFGNGRLDGMLSELAD